MSTQAEVSIASRAKSIGCDECLLRWKLETRVWGYEHCERYAHNAIYLPRASDEAMQGCANKYLTAGYHCFSMVQVGIHEGRGSQWLESRLAIDQFPQPLFDTLELPTKT